jgi:hypothetical protein
MRCHNTVDYIYPVAGKHARIGEVEIDEVVAIDVGESSAATGVDEHRRMSVELRHPRHRDTVRHR